MIQAYSQNITVNASQPIPFYSVAVDKGCSVSQNGSTTFNLNKCGVYQVCVGVSAAAAETIQLYKDGVALPGAVSTGTSPSFVSFVQVDHDNTCCPCTSPTSLQVMAEAEGTLTEASIAIHKIA